MKHLFTYLFFLLVTIHVRGQSNNLCPQTGVPVLPVNSCSGPSNYNVASTFTVDPTTSLPVGTTCVTASRNSRDGWYQFTATTTATTIIGTVISRDLAIAVYSGTCGAMTELGCVNAGGNGVTETLTFTTTPGTVYYIRLIRYNSTSSNDMTGTISILSPVPNNECTGAITLTPAVPAGACNQTCGHIYNATGSSPATACTGAANMDVWYQFTPTQAQHVITVGGSTTFNPVVELLSGNCGALTSLACADVTGDGGTENLTYNNFIPGNTYYIRVYDFGPTPPTTFQFNICITTPVMPTCPASLGGGVVNVSSLPYNATGRTTTGAGDEFTASNTITCGSSTYLQGNDEVFIFTPSVSGVVSITLTSASTNVGMMLYNGCPFTGSGSSCIGYSQSTSGNQFLCSNVNAGTQYYLIVDRNSVGGSIPSYNITISAPATGANGATCGTAIVIPSLPYSITNQTTLCKGDDYNTGTMGSCNSLYESGEDMVFQFNASSAQCIHIVLSNTSSAQAGFLLYQNCPGSAGANCLGYVGGGNVTGNFSLPGAGTYFIIVDSWSPPGSVTFNLSVSSTSGTSPNDYPCNAISLPLGLPMQGDNSCSTGLLEPGAPSCWTGGALNTVWYTVFPTGTSLTIRTTLGTLGNTQIAVYRGSCSALTQVTPTSSSCNTDIANCGLNVTLNSEVTVTGLTPQTYYIRVDGELDMTGTFGILAVDGATGLPAVFGQDCALPLPVCQNTITVGDPGYSGTGNVCEFGAFVNCLSSGERASAWYRIPIASNGTLQFDIIPNDYPGAPSIVATDYDFAIWEVGQSGISCSQLSTAAPVRCNYNSLGVTGLYTLGNAPFTYPGFDASYELPIIVTAGQVYMLLVSNFTSSSAGFTMNFTGLPDPINYSVAPSGMNWLGGTNTSWGVTGNWGSCTIPNCAIDAVINPGPINQPIVVTNQTVKDLFINPGSTLTINPNVTLSVCGNLSNSGTFIALPGSTIKFIGAGAQTVLGNFTNGNAFANFVMQKPSGTLNLLTNVDITENDSLKSGLFNANGKYIRIKKNFYNANGSLTHITPATGSTYEFNGAASQTFTNNGDDINFNNVFMNQSPASSLILGAGAFNNLNTLGILNLTNGKIITGVTKEVVVKNPANAAIISHNVNSYVEGNLRRYLNTNATGVYDFPVGHSAKGYQLARTDFATATQIPQLVAKFTPWPVVPNGPNSNECPNINYSLYPVLNNGYWTIDASANVTTGIYNMTLFNLNYSNPASGWTIMKRSPSAVGAWALDGTCVVTSTVGATQRTGMSGFSDFATAQSGLPLPIELIRFDASSHSGKVVTKWETASEVNNDYFIVERSTDAITFSKIGIVNGAGTTSEHNLYSLTDLSPVVGLNYYRLKQVDFDGGYTFSDIVAVKVNGSVNDITIYPNPANSVIRFDFSSESTSIIHVEVVDIMGKVVMSELKKFRKESGEMVMDIKNLSDGVYYLKVVEDDVIFKGKFFKFGK